MPIHTATVSTLSIDEVRELFELRALIESDLLRRAIPQLTESDLKRAAEILTKYEEAFRSGDYTTRAIPGWPPAGKVP